MKYYKTALIILVITNIFAIIAISTNAPDIDDIEVEVQEAVYLQSAYDDGRAHIKVTIKNNSPKSLRIRGSKLVSYAIGFQVGMGEHGKLTIEPGSEKSIKFLLYEDWSQVPLHEPGWHQNYDFITEILDLKGSTLEFVQINPTPRSIAPILVIDPEPVAGEPDEYLDQFYMNIRSGGPPKDGIPPIDEPKFIAVDQVDLDDSEIVILYEANEQVRIYPRYILVWHEIVNDNITDENISITYCPLTGSAIGYYGENTTYGTSGKLVNSNLIMYDRATDSYWPQILGTSIRGKRKAETLNRVNLVWTRWGLVKSVYPDALVLSEDTGNPSPYGADPYGSYENPRGYYTSGDGFMGVMNKDVRLEPKEVVIGIINGENQLAIPKQIVSEKGVLNSEIDDIPIVAFYDPRLDTVRVFKRPKNQTYAFLDGNIIDDDEIVWDVYGSSEDDQLVQLKHFDVMWFGWSAFYPNTKLIENIL